jgi:RimJ/RimL family protein N-acetyltransferase
MIAGERVRLRLFREEDLERYHVHHTNLEVRGPHYPLEVSSLPTLRGQFRENGFWDEAAGMLAIVDADDTFLGEVYFYRTMADEPWTVEVGCLLYDVSLAGQGIGTEAIRLITEHLFAATNVYRVQAAIFTENAAARRIVEKAGFRFEGVARGAVWHGGRPRDIEIHARLRTDQV